MGEQTRRIRCRRDGDRIPRKLEHEFAHWMRSHLGYQVSQVHVLVVNETGAQRRVVSVRGETYGIAWYRLRIFAIGVLAVGVVLRNVISVPDGEIPWVPTVLVYLSVVAFVVALLGRVRTRRYAWVECKDPKRRVSLEDIRSVNDEVEKVRAGRAARWKPTRVLVVTGTKGFESKGLALAASLSIECYRRTKAGFERATSPTA